MGKEESQVPRKVCPKCGRAVEKGETRCAACGADVDTATQGTATAAANDDPKWQYADLENRIEGTRFVEPEKAQFRAGCCGTTVSRAS